MTMTEAIEGFLLCKRAENSSPCTIRAYRSDLVDLSNFMGSEQGPERISREIVRGFLAFLHRRVASKTTAVRKLSAIKSFVTWLRNDGIIVCAGGILPTPFLKEIGIMVESKFGTE